MKSKSVLLFLRNLRARVSAPAQSASAVGRTSMPGPSLGMIAIPRLRACGAPLGMTAGLAQFGLASFAQFGFASFGLASFGLALFGLATVGLRRPGVAVFGVAPLRPSPASRLPTRATDDNWDHEPRP